MSYVLVRHKVADYAKWKRTVRSAAAWRKASGELSFQVFRSSVDPNDLTVLCRWAGAAQMKKFVESAELRERMQQAGVINKPDIQFFSKAEDLSVS
jgi:quinol monooxygenase YgiN